MKVRFLFRIVSVILGISAIAATLLSANQLLQVIAENHRAQLAYGSSVSGIPVGVYVYFLIVVSFSLAIAYLCLSYAVTGSRSSTVVPTEMNRTSKFFRSLAVASTSVLTLSFASQFIFLIVQAIRLRLKPMPQEIRESMRVVWSPFVWETIRDSRCFWISSIVVFALAFGWTYRMASQASVDATVRRSLGLLIASVGVAIIILYLPAKGGSEFVAIGGYFSTETLLSAALGLGALFAGVQLFRRIA